MTEKFFKVVIAIGIDMVEDHQLVELLHDYHPSRNEFLNHSGISLKEASYLK